LILYLDASSLVKLYVEEAYSNTVRDWAEEAEIIATCRVAYPETISASFSSFDKKLNSAAVADGLTVLGNEK